VVHSTPALDVLQFDAAGNRHMMWCMVASITREGEYWCSCCSWWEEGGILGKHTIAPALFVFALFLFAWLASWREKCASKGSLADRAGHAIAGVRRCLRLLEGWFNLQARLTAIRSFLLSSPVASYLSFVPLLSFAASLQLSKNVRRQIRQYVAPSDASEQAKGPVEYAVSDRAVEERPVRFNAVW